MTRTTKPKGTSRRRDAPAGPARVIDSTELMRHLVEWDGRAAFSLRSRLEDYLARKLVLRARAGEIPPNLLSAKLMSEADLSREIAKAAQDFVDALLRRVLAGEDPRTVFRLDDDRRGVKRAPARELAAVHELARLRAASVSNATELVAKAFAATPRTLERWCARWDVGQVNVPEYVEQLRAAGYL